MVLKRTVMDATLKNLYVQTIRALESNLKELLAFYPKAPNSSMRNGKQEKDPETGFFAGEQLLANDVQNAQLALSL